MTRDFDKQRRERNNVRPYARNPQSGRPDEEQNAPPARPRLNRETVDRAWENGAPINHADYHPRTSGGNPRPSGRQYGQTPRPSGQQYGQAPRSSEQYGRSPNRRDYDTGRTPERNDRRQNPNQNANPNQNSYPRTPGPRTRPYNPRERQFEGQPSGERREYGSGPNAGNRGNRYERPNSRPANGREDERREPGYPNRYARPANRETRPPRYNDRGPRPYQSGQPSETRGPRPYQSGQPSETRGPRPYQSGQPFETRGPRPYQSGQPSTRPHQHRQPSEARETRPPYRHNDKHDAQEQFKGDYEQFNSHDDREQSEHRENRPAPQRTDQRQPEEKHVTRLPDGRVLRGPRPAQRKNARFWGEVAEDTSTLLPETQTEPEQQQARPEQRVELAEHAELIELAEQPEVSLQQPETTTTRKPRRPMGGTTARGKKTGAKESRAKGSSDGPRPSQRGYKWPTS